MDNAIGVVIFGRCGYLKASNEFDVPQTTLERYVEKKKRQILSI